MEIRKNVDGFIERLKKDEKTICDEIEKLDKIEETRNLTYNERETRTFLMSRYYYISDLLCEMGIDDEEEDDE